MWLARSCGRYRIRLWRGTDEDTITVRTYRVPDDAPTVPLLHCFVLPEWWGDDAQVVEEQVAAGVVPSSRPYDKGRRPGWWFRSRRYCGRPEAWLLGPERGVDPPLRWLRGGISVCCLRGNEQAVAQTQYRVPVSTGVLDELEDSRITDTGEGAVSVLAPVAVQESVLVAGAGPSGGTATLTAAGGGGTATAALVATPAAGGPGPAALELVAGGATTTVNVVGPEATATLTAVAEEGGASVALTVAHPSLPGEGEGLHLAVTPTGTVLQVVPPPGGGTAALAVGPHQGINVSDLLGLQVVGGLIVGGTYVPPTGGGGGLTLSWLTNHVDFATVTWGGGTSQLVTALEVPPGNVVLGVVARILAPVTVTGDWSTINLQLDAPDWREGPSPWLDLEDPDPHVGKIINGMALTGLTTLDPSTLFLRVLRGEGLSAITGGVICVAVLLLAAPCVVPVPDPDPI